MKVFSFRFLTILFLILSQSPLRACPGEDDLPSSGDDFKDTTAATATVTERNREEAGTVTSRSTIVSRGIPLSIATSENSPLLPIETGKYSDFLNSLLPNDVQNKKKI